jgi:hypothetical protein
MRDRPRPITYRHYPPSWVLGLWALFLLIVFTGVTSAA